MTSTPAGGRGDSLDAALVLASDVHLRRPDDERSQLLLDAIQRLAPSVEHLILNGDIFDFCFGDSAYFRDKFAPLGAALSAAAARGTRVTFVEGNHEFRMHAMGWDGVHIVAERDVVLTLRSGERLKVSHGDLVVDDPWYRAFRGFVKSRFAGFVARTIPARWLDAYALKHASVSRAQDRYRTLDHAKILSGFDRWLAEGGCRHGIIGHFHVPYAESRPGGEGMMLSVDSWDRPNLLIYRKGVFWRTFLREPGSAWALEQAESVFKTP